MITANPPYVPAAFSHAKYGDGGADGEQITARLRRSRCASGGRRPARRSGATVQPESAPLQIPACGGPGHATMPSAGGNVLQGEQHAAVHVYHSQALSPAGLTALYDLSIQAGATDGGPWLAQRMAARQLSWELCSLAALNACDSAFAEVWTTPLAGTEGRKVSELCPYACVHRLRGGRRA